MASDLSRRLRKLEAEMPERPSAGEVGALERIVAELTGAASPRASVGPLATDAFLQVETPRLWALIKRHRASQEHPS